MPIVISKWQVYSSGYLDEIMHSAEDELHNILETAIQEEIKDLDNEYKDPKAPRKIAIELSFQRTGDKNSGMVGVDWKITPKPAPFDRTPKGDQAQGQMSMNDYPPEEDSEE